MNTALLIVTKTKSKLLDMATPFTFVYAVNELIIVTEVPSRLTFFSDRPILSVTTALTGYEAEHVPDPGKLFSPLAHTVQTVPFPLVLYVPIAHAAHAVDSPSRK